MKPETRRRLLDVSARFYEQHGTSFDGTRSHPWPGWERLWNRVGPDLPENLQCLDAGCGNGRFALFLNCRAESLRYTGVDLNTGLLDSARRDLADLEQAELIRRDLIRDGVGDLVPPESQNLVVLFGVLHHVPDERVRHRLLQGLGKLVARRGALVTSIWRLDQDPNRFARKLIPWAEWNDAQDPGNRADVTDLDEGDVLLGWRGDRATPRYCHFPTEAEIERLADLGPDLRLGDRFEADGPTGRDNLYLVWQRPAAC